MGRWLYTGLLHLIMPFAVMRLFVRSRKNPAYKQRIRERFGCFPKTALSGQAVIWIHSVSLGETLASELMVREMMSMYPHHRFLITTMTPTGSDCVKKLYGNTVDHYYLPYDLPLALKRFFHRFSPKLAVIVETELWPNMLHQCRSFHVPVILVNARLSERSAKGYKKISRLTREMLDNVTMVACQHQADSERFQSLGLAEGKCCVTGSIKFDLTVGDAVIEAGKQLRGRWESGLEHPARIWIAASTHEGEDEVILSVFQSLKERFTDLLLVLVPRHPERFDSVFHLCLKKGLSVVRHSQGSVASPETQVILGDTMGEMLTFYGASDIAFVGGSLVATGGHNILEPAVLGLPVLTGPHVFNFQAISQSLQQAGGMLQVDNQQKLEDALSQMLSDTQQFSAMGKKARAFVHANQGALQKLLQLVQKTLQEDKAS
ncbi:3-deoxy-D-manno-octulosonic acid transferase [invertebrate metagenome]|uniref:lipid IVA 3-deoxy-D-manno-octulosonic acid transferase n=1 Tax=invertebrate metagenome TaxID=1711999 RepID=A0A2H9TCK3_9ZZZZ